VKEKMHALNRLTYRSELLALIRFLHLTSILRKCYYRWAVSRGELLRTNLDGIDVEFFACTPAELRGVEGALVAEQDFLGVLISTLRPGDTFLDIGSRIGLFAIPLARVVGEQGQVIAFEPEARAYQRLLAHLELNGLSNVRVFRQALGDDNATGRLFVGGEACPSLLAHSGDAEQQTVSEDVEVVRGDWLRENENLPVPRAVKIDVEGYEYAVLRGLQRTLAQPACELLCVEIHPSFLPSPVTVETILQFVKNCGFTRLDLPPRWPQIHMVAHKSVAAQAAAQARALTSSARSPTLGGSYELGGRG
jgi:FkbM family methyltransferase